MYKSRFEQNSEVCKKVNSDSKDKIVEFYVKKDNNTRLQINKAIQINMDSNTKRKLLNKIDREYSKIKRMPNWEVKYGRNSVNLDHIPKIDLKVKNVKRDKSAEQNSINIFDSAKTNKMQGLKFVDFMKDKGVVNKNCKLVGTRDFLVTRKNSISRTWQVDTSERKSSISRTWQADTSERKKRSISRTKPKILKGDPIENVNFNKF